MASQKQIDANRLNAKKSTGPRTEEGKRKSSMNAYKHGLTGQTILMTAEQCEAREEFCKSIFNDLRPIGGLEEALARSIADTRFRINRVVTIEDNLFAYEAWHEEGQATSEFNDIDRALAEIRSFVMDPKRFQLLTIYEARLQRKFQTEMKQFRELQAVRKAAETQPQEPRAEAAKVMAVAARTSESIESTEPIGFQFQSELTKEQIDAYIGIPPGHDPLDDLLKGVPGM